MNSRLLTHHFPTFPKTAFSFALVTALTLIANGPAQAATFGSDLAGGDLLDGGNSAFFIPPTQDLRDIVEDALR